MNWFHGNMAIIRHFEKRIQQREILSSNRILRHWIEELLGYRVIFFSKYSDGFNDPKSRVENRRFNIGSDMQLRRISQSFVKMMDKILFLKIQLDVVA